MDDKMYLWDSPLIKSPTGLYSFWFTTEAVDYYPVSNTSLWVEWRLWGMNPIGYRVTNLSLHVLTALLVWAILLRLGIPGAFLAAILFAVHPVNVESVAWISQRKDVLAAFFLLISTYFFLKDEGPSAPCSGRDSNAPVGGRHAERATFSLGGTWHWLSIFAFVLAMLSKGSVATFPLLLLLIVWWLRGRITLRDALRSVPFWFVAIALTLVTASFKTLGSSDAVKFPGALDRAAGAGKAIWFYLSKALWPAELVFIYPRWRIQISELGSWLPLLAAIAVTVVLWWRHNDRVVRPLCFAWTFFCLALFPALGFIDVGFFQYSQVADHYQHIAILAPVAVVAAAASSALNRAHGWMRAAIFGLVVVVVAALTWRANMQSRLYESTLTLYEATEEKNPGSWQVQAALGTALMRANRLDEAIDHFKRSLTINQSSADTHSNLGFALAAHGQPAEAVAEYLRSLKLNPDDCEVYVNLALAYAQTGKQELAIKAAEKALDLARRQQQTDLTKTLEAWLKEQRAEAASGASKGS
jgi:protein O-mannosyl-transferase